MLLFAWVLLLRMRTALNDRKLRALRLHGLAAREAGRDDLADRRPAGVALT